MLAKSLENCKNLIENAQNVVITTHLNPDGDAIGSVLALYHVLKSLNKNVTVINNSPTPYNLKFLVDSDKIHLYSPKIDDEIIQNADTIFILDLSQLSRLQSMESIIKNSTARKIVVDHHPNPGDFSDCLIWDTSSSSTGELVWRVIQTLGKELVTKQVAEALYTAIHSDTGGFRFSNTDAELHRIIANLLEIGVNPTEMYEEIYNQNPAKRSLLLGNALSNLEFYCEYKFCVMPISKAELDKLGCDESMTEGFVQHTLEIMGVKMGVLVVETEDLVKMSFRSKGEISANQIAGNFGGGGHKNAAGARIKGVSMREVIQQIVEKAKKILT